MLGKWPQLIDRLPIEKMNGEDIAWVLRDQPQLIDRLPIEKMDGWDIRWTLRNQPQLEGIIEKKRKESN
jgi:hypothetical protein